jgi:hypothetical protein
LSRRLLFRPAAPLRFGDGAAPSGAHCSFTGWRFRFIENSIRAGAERAVSRTTVRQTIQNLVGRGLIEIRRGARPTAMNDKISP